MGDTEHEIAILIMGPSGSGKSNLIDALSGREAAKRLNGNLRRPFGQVLPIVLSSHMNNQLAFVEFPGFDSNSDPRTEAETLHVISKWLQEAFSKSVIIAGVLYVHNISDSSAVNRPPSRTFRIFQALCGEAALPRTALITSGWDLMDDQVGKQQENKLNRGLWKGLLEAGSHYARFDNTFDGAWSIVNNLMDVLGHNAGQMLCIHREIEIAKLKLSETRVGQTLLSTVKGATSRVNLVAVLDGWANLFVEEGLILGWHHRIPVLFRSRRVWENIRFWKKNKAPRSQELAQESLVEPPASLRPLILKIARNHETRRLIGDLKAEDAQHMAQYLNEVLESGTLVRRDKKYLLALLCQLAFSAAVYPSTYLLQSGISLKPPSVSTRGMYLLHHGQLGNQSLCVKLLPKFPVLSAEELWKVKVHVREIALWSYLRHPKILPFFGVTGSNLPGPRIAFVSPWLKNQSLGKYLQTHHSMSKRVLLLSDVVEGLDYLHENGIIHGNLRSSNILVSDEGHAMIMDFKSSRIYLGGTSDQTLDGSSYSDVPSPQWTAPELLRLKDYRPPTKPGDVWSFACLCYEVLGGKTPYYQYKNTLAACWAMAQNMEIPLRLVIITDEMWELLVSCWNYQPENRPRVHAIHNFFINIMVHDERPQALSSEEITKLQRSLRAKPFIHVDYPQIHRILEDIASVFPDLLKNNEVSSNPESRDDTSVERTHESSSPLNITSSVDSFEHLDNSSSPIADRYSHLRNSLVTIIHTIPFQIILKRLGTLKQEYSQIMADFIDTALQERSILTNTGQHMLHMLCKLASSAGVYPRSYELEGVQFNPRNPHDFLGHGGYATVYTGSHQGRSICVKVFRQARDATSFNAYVKELTMWAHLSHPNILPFYGVCLAEETPVPQLNLVSPYMKNGNLHSYAKTLLPVDRLPLIYDVIRGLSYLHKLEIVHSDLKGNNVLVSDDRRALITDFGTSHIASATQATTRGTTGSPIGFTAPWAAPELLEAGENLRPRKSCDIWSFGCLCYEILSGRLPFHRSTSNYAVIVAITVRRELPSRPMPHEQNCDMIEDWMWDLMKRCWEFSPPLRPKCKDIQEIMGHTGIQSGEPNLEDTGALLMRGRGPRRIELDLTCVEEVIRHIQNMASSNATLGSPELPQPL